ncbi:MAG: MFS transporter, partial [Phenylobacterium sp.]
TMFLLEGLPAILLGIVVLFRMTDRPQSATWLDGEERAVLQQALDREAEPAPDHLHGLTAALRSLQVWRFALMYFGVVMGNYGLSFWLPQIVKGFGGLSNAQTGLLTAAPYLAAAIGMYLWGHHSDRTGERLWHFVLPVGIASLGFVAAAWIPGPAIQFTGLAIAIIGVSAAAPMLWNFPTRILRASAAAGGIALINSVGNLAGYAGPSVMGFVKQATGGYSGGMLVLAAALATAVALAFSGPRPKASP